MAKTVANQSRTAQVNTFTGGINTDLHPLLQPNDTLTDCVNGTLITYNGNENMLQNDMGNYELKNAKLPPGYIPMGMKEHQGVLYMVLMNPITKKVQIGSYPSPQTDFGSASETQEYYLYPVEIGTIEDLEIFAQIYYPGRPDIMNENISEVIWGLIDCDLAKIDDSIIEENSKFKGLTKRQAVEKIQSLLLASKLDRSKSSVVMTTDFDENDYLTLGDRYRFRQIGDDASEISDYEANPPFQNLNFFTINNDKEKFNIDLDDVYESSDSCFEDDEWTSETSNNVAWESNGWFGAEFILDEAPEVNQTISTHFTENIVPYHISEYSKITNFSEINSDSSSDTSSDSSLEGIKHAITEFTYKIGIGGVDVSNRVIDFENWLSSADIDNKLIILNGDVPKDWDPSVKPISIDVLDLSEDIVPGYDGEYKLLGLECSYSTPEYQLIPNNYMIGVFPSRQLAFPINPYVKACYRNVNLDDIRQVEDPEYKYMDIIVIGPEAKVTGRTDSTTCLLYCFDPDGTKPKYGNAKHEYYDKNSTWYQLFADIPSDDTIRLYSLIDMDSTEKYTAGLSGTWNNSEYTVGEQDDYYALEDMLDTLTRCDILLPNNLKIKTLKGKFNNYIIPYDNDSPIRLKVSARQNDWWISGNIKSTYGSIDNVIPNLAILKPHYYSNNPNVLVENQIVETIDTYCLNADISIPNYDYHLQKYLNIRFKAYKPSNLKVYVENEKLYVELSVLFSQIDKEAVYYGWTGENIQKYSYLFDDVDVSIRFKTWYTDSNNKLLAQDQIRFTSTLKAKTDDKYVVPEDFDGWFDNKLVDTPDGKIWRPSFKSTMYIDPISSQSLMEVLTNTEKPVNVNTATKVYNSTVDETHWYNTTATHSVHRYRTNRESQDVVYINSVAYKRSGNHLLIYDSNVQSDVLGAFNKSSNQIKKFQYNTVNGKTSVVLNTANVVDLKAMWDTLCLFTCVNNSLIKQKSFVKESSGDIIEGMWSDHFEFNFSADQEVYDELFIFLGVYIGDEYVVLPINTKVTDSNNTTLIDKYDNFADAFINEFPKKNENNLYIIDDSSITSTNKYITATFDDNVLEIIHESDRPYYWYNNIVNKSILGDETTSKIYYFGKANRIRGKVNLTQMGLSEGDIITVTGMYGKDYDGITINVSNTELFEKVGTDIYLKIDTLGAYSLKSYKVIFDPSKSIPVRRYLIHHCQPPICHSEADLQWENTPIGEHAGWDSKGLEQKQLYVTKSAAGNSNVQINTISATPESYDENSNTFKKGKTVTTEGQAREVIEKVVGKNTCKQMFTLVKCELDTNDGGFTIPVPRMAKGDYKLSWTKGKKYKGTDRAVVLMRDSGGLAWVNSMHKAIAYTGIVGGVAAMATMVVMGCIAAGSAAVTATAVAATAAAALAAIPFVGWAILAAAVVAASIALLCKVTAGENKDFEFWAMRGPESQRLILPLWGTHLGRGGKSPGKNNYKAWMQSNGKCSKHPWYLDQNFRYTEELITFIMTHVYYVSHINGFYIEEMSNPTNKNSLGAGITITTSNASPSMYGVSKYVSIEDYLYKTNNFDTIEDGEGSQFSVISTSSEIENDFNIDTNILEDNNSENCVYKYDCIVPNDDDDNDTKCLIESLNSEFSLFCGNLKYDDSPENVYYGGPIFTSQQGAFGGNAGGRNAKFKTLANMWISPPSKYKMIDGDYPRNDKGYVPVAYPVDNNSKDTVMVKHYGWGTEWSDEECNTTLNKEKFKNYLCDWGISKNKFQSAEDTWEKGSKYYDYIRWDSYSDEFKLTCNTNEISIKA